MKKKKLAEEFLKFLEKNDALEEFKFGYKTQRLNLPNTPFNSYVRKSCTSFGKAQGLLPGAFPWHHYPTKNWAALHIKWIKHTKSRLKKEIKKGVLVEGILKEKPKHYRMKGEIL